MHAEPSVHGAGCVRCGFDAAVDGVPRSCPACEAVAVGDYCGRCGVELEHGHGARRAMRSLFQPIAEYVEHARALIRPNHVIHEIRERRFTIVELVGFWVAAILICTLIMAVLPMHKEAGGPAPPPIVTEAIAAIYMMTVVTLLYAPLHLILRVGRRDVSVRECVMVILTIMALVLPWSVLVQSAMTVLGLSGAPYVGFALLLPPVTLALSNLYRRHPGTVAAMVVGYFGLLLALLIGLVVTASLVTHRPIDSFFAKPEPIEHRE